MNRFISIYQNQSTILGPSSGPSMMTEFVVRGNLDNLRGHMLQIKGGTDGDYLNSQGKRVPSKLVLLQGQQKDLEDQWERFCQSRIAIGEPKPKTWPTHLKDLKDRLDAKLQVSLEEIAWLKMEIDAAEQGKASRERKTVPPQYWGTGQLRNGELVSFCGWSVEKDDTGLLRIQDPSSPYTGIEVWKMKSQVINPMQAEFRLRKREEEAAALAENRPRNNVLFPATPMYDKEHDNIEYPADYHLETLRKIKLQNENI